MNDRFRFRAYNKELRKMYEVDNICPYEDNHTKGGEVFLKGIQYNSFYFPEEVEIMQCTGLKDKNGKLIYEGDIVKYAEFDWTDFSFKDWETEIAQVVWGNIYDNYYPAFDLKDTDFDGTNAFAYLFNEGWTVEVIGNIYENKELLQESEVQN